MQRVMVIGPSGAGKTTLARKIAVRCNLPHYDLDYHFWRPNWIEPSKDEWRATVERLAALSGWVMSGNYSKSFDIRMPRADTIIWLDFSRWLCMTRILRRIARDYGCVREGMAEGCPERLDWKFLKFAWTFNRVHRSRFIAALEKYAVHARVHQFHSDAEAAQLLASLEAG